MRRGTRNLLLVLAAAACGVSLWLGRPAGRGPAPSGEAPDGPALHLVVLNGTGEPNLARDAALALGLAGCVTERMGNAPHDRFRRTLLVDRRLDGAAERLARRLGGVPVLREVDPAASEDAVLVLGADHAQALSGLAGAGAP